MERDEAGSVPVRDHRRRQAHPRAAGGREPGRGGHYERGGGRDPRRWCGDGEGRGRPERIHRQRAGGDRDALPGRGGRGGGAGVQAHGVVPGRYHAADPEQGGLPRLRGAVRQPGADSGDGF